MNVTRIRSGSCRWTGPVSAVAFLTAMTVSVSQLIPAAHFFRSAHAENSASLDGFSERGRLFSERDIRGPHGFFFQGFVTVPLPEGSTTSVPVSAVGHLVADGMGGLPEGSRTLNLGGVILEQVAQGSYQVRPDGTGTATIELRVVDQIGTLPDGLAFPSEAIESFSFVLTNRAAGIPFIGRAIVDAESRQSVGAVTIRGEAHRQR